LKVGILVSGGIAPGINAVIDGIAQRHWLYAKQHAVGRPHPGVEIYGLRDGFLSKGRIQHSVMLRADKQQPIVGWNGEVFDTPNHAHEGGSILGTSRVGALLHAGNRIDVFKEIDENLLNSGLDILYLIGGDGSMKAAHALHQISHDNPKRVKQKKMLSVVAIPKTMDNDILWMWQSFGFLSAVEKAREVTEHLNTETQSNPRLCIVQLFGSDSGFVVSHTVLASATGHCNAALIPEVKFSMKGLISHLRRVLDNPDGRPPHGIVVMAETAIPTDALSYIQDANIALTEDEVEEIKRFSKMRDTKRRIEGQTEDALRSARLKIVSRGLLNYLPEGDPNRSEQLLRVVTNEPRHQLRSIPPSCLDIILGQRLGTLAVDNAVAGYTDFMISQWLTEYVLVPLKLVVLGRKRIPETGIFWKSVLDKTRQPANMV
jgi:6-phosphofructokinase 1